jgi:hypothetical protein
MWCHNEHNVTRKQAVDYATTIFLDVLQAECKQAQRAMPAASLQYGTPDPGRPDSTDTAVWDTVDSSAIWKQASGRGEGGCPVSEVGRLRSIGTVK